MLSHCSLRQGNQCCILSADRAKGVWMTNHTGDMAFTNSIAEVYDRDLRPLIFEAYARDLAQIVASEPVSRVLEIAAGTGVVTKELFALLGDDALIEATDINQSMIDLARSGLDYPSIRWTCVDAMDLPFNAGCFDAVVCQFSAMFFPDRVRAFAEAKRVLRPRGRFIMSVWDHIGVNTFAQTVEEALAGVFPSDPPRFMSSTPHGYSDAARVIRDVHDGGFDHRVKLHTFTHESKAPDPDTVARAFCCGTPLRIEIEQRDAGGLERAVTAARLALEDRFGDRDLVGTMRAHVVVAVV